MYAPPGGYAAPSAGYTPGYGQPVAPGGYGQPVAPSGYGQPVAPSGYGQPVAPSGYGQPVAPSGYGQPVAPFSGYGYTPFMPASSGPAPNRLARARGR